MVLSSLGSPDTFSENTRTQFCVQFKEFHRPVTNRICSNTGPSSLLPRSVREPSVLCSQFNVHSDFLRSPVSLQKAAATHPQHSSPSLVAGRRQSKTKQKRASDLKNEVAGRVCGPFVPSLRWCERGKIGQDLACASLPGPSRVAAGRLQLSCL